MSFNENFKNLKFDKRMKDWNIKQGFVTDGEFKKHLNSLEDVQDQSVDLSLETSIEKSPDIETKKPITESEQIAGNEAFEMKEAINMDKDPSQI